jgi:hypothetical protein
MKLPIVYPKMGNTMRHQISAPLLALALTLCVQPAFAQTANAPAPAPLSNW